MSYLYSLSDNSAIVYDLESPRQFTKLSVIPAVSTNLISNLKTNQKNPKDNFIINQKNIEIRYFSNFSLLPIKETLLGGLTMEDLLP